MSGYKQGRRRDDSAEYDGVVVFVLALAALVPCVGGALDDRLPGIAAGLYEGGAILVTAALVWCVAWRPDRKQVVAFLLSGVNAPVLLWLLVVVGSWAFAPTPGAFRHYSTQEMLRQAAGVAIYFAVIARFRQASQWVQLALTLLLTGLVVAVMGCIQYSQHVGGMATGPYHDHQLCGSCLAVLLPLAASMAFGAWETNRQLLAQAAAALMAVGLLLTYTRSSWIGAGAGICAVCAIAIYPYASDAIEWCRSWLPVGERAGRAVEQADVAVAEVGAGKHRLVLPLMIALAVVGFVAMLAHRGNGVNDRLGTLSRLTTDRSWNSRLTAWQGAASLVGQHPLLGVGIGQYAVVQHDYTHLSVAINRIGGRPSLAEQAHNIYLQTAAEVGIIGLIAFAAIPCAFLLQGVSHVTSLRPGPRQFLLLGIIGSIIAFLVDAFANPAWQCSQVSILMWLLLGLGACCLRPRERSGPGAEARAELAPLAVRCVGASVCLLLLLLPTIVWSVSGTFPDHVEIEPKQVDGDGSQPVELHLFLVNTDGSRREVTGVAGTRFLLGAADAGQLRKVGRRIYYVATPGTAAGTVIIGIFKGATPDVVAPRDRDACAVQRHPKER